MYTACGMLLFKAFVECFDCAHHLFTTSAVQGVITLSVIISIIIDKIQDSPVLGFPSLNVFLRNKPMISRAYFVLYSL